ncbi:MAG TPA: transposase [Longimicrobiaceae bacterium]|nr:transposase [Longimicrobiaceae bacterium]
MHLVWATWDRIPWLVPGAREKIYACIEAHARKLDAHVLAIGGVEDHVHEMARDPARISVAELVRHLKGGSSHYATVDLMLADPFRWQGTYGAFSLSRRALDRVGAYIAAQEDHHRHGTLLPPLESTAAE